MNGRDKDRFDLGRAVAGWVLSTNGGRMNGKSMVAVVIGGLVILGGFIAYRLVALELITNLRH
ncbi:hypothetical protein Sru01_13040 [Sphaerisporangium rufum]|uniref:Uncharacterized protein n=1 Tax=Sphaerisporangium rufum TaxID=1381558 RepID=A0A919QYI0_9ACTN|nr:hypothetical protein [Sphaerisporangium rufum]GII76322.1 hypothetical protein Sru01_13040 [Sphaerisporangium rufum]